MGEKPVDGPYYTAYEQRYQAVYAQGVQYWTAFPAELDEIRSDVSAFLESTGLPEASRVIEFGCGEGYVGELAIAHGCCYTGVDLAESALAKARERLPSDKHRIGLIRADVTDLREVPSATFDAGVDVGCLHMLVTDSDRMRYLREAHRVLNDGAPMLVKNAVTTDPRCDEQVDTLNQWVDRFDIDLVSRERREAWTGNHKVAVNLRLLPARPRTLDGYRRELETAGFVVEQHTISDDSMRVAIIARAV